MKIDSRDSLKEYCDYLAETAAGRHFSELSSFIHALGLADEGRSRAGPPIETDSIPQRIGPWEREHSDGEASFRRSPEAGFFEPWSNAPAIPAKSARKRVVFLGESVARGFFYEPQFTPAGVLEEMLNRHGLPGQAEVVDLAMHDMRGDFLLSLLKGAACLKPDLCVVFAGNNWACGLPPEIAEERNFKRLVAHALERDGLAGMRACISREVASYSGELVGRIQATCRELAVPLVFVLPDCNLTHWHPQESCPCPWLPREGNEAWNRCAELARTALKNGDMPGVRQQAEIMRRLDGGTASLGAFLLGRCALGEGSVQEARKHFQAARDASLGLRPYNPPTPFGVVQEAIRSSAREEGTFLVDLPKVFDARSGGTLPGHQFFLDYCHLTSQGILIAMAETAKAIRRAWKEDSGEASTGSMEGIQRPSPELEAEARMGAAIHNAHWGQPREGILSCLEAMPSSADADEALVRLLTCIARKTPSWMLPEGRELFDHARSKYLKSYIVVSWLARETNRFDHDLSEAVLEVLERRGVQRRHWLRELRCGESPNGLERSWDFLDPSLAPCGNDPDRRWMTVPEISCYYKAFSPVSKFFWVAGDSGPARILLTCRAGDRSPGEACRLVVNGRECARFTPAGEWKTFELPIEAGSRFRGTNVVEVHWPRRPVSEPSAMARKRRRRMLEGIESLDSFYPYYGEIHSMHAR